jgi:methionyl-tRNA formyltransferase
MASPGDGALRIVFLGTADFAVPVLRALAAGPDEIASVITPPDRRAGRGRKLRPPPVKRAAQDLGLPVSQPERASSEDGLAQLRRLSPDLLFVVAFGEILSPEVLAIPRLGAVNLHASLLPRHRGAAPIQRALMGGERLTGVSVQWMVAEMDAGDIILQRETEIGEEESFGELHDRLAVLGAEAAIASLGLIREQRAPRSPQDHSQATFAPPITPEDRELDWNGEAVELAHQIRALAPVPGARTTRRGGFLKVLATRPGKYETGGGGIPGEIMELSSDGFLVATGQGYLLVLRVQPAGRTAMSATDYLKGYPVEIGERLGD